MDQMLTSSTPIPARGARTLVWIGRVLSGLVVAFLLVDAVFKLFPPAVVVESTTQLGYAAEVIRPLGVVLAVSTILHVVPRTQLLGALLLTAYLGGATATHVRAGQPFWAPIAFGVILWAGLCLRQPRVRALIFAPSAA